MRRRRGQTLPGTGIYIVYCGTPPNHEQSRRKRGFRERKRGRERVMGARFAPGEKRLAAVCAGIGRSVRRSFSWGNKADAPVPLIGSSAPCKRSSPLVLCDIHCMNALVDNLRKHDPRKDDPRKISRHFEKRFATASAANRHVKIASA